MNTLTRLVAISAALATPLFASAQTGINTAYITPYSNSIINIINGILVPVLIAIAFIVFLYGVFKYFIYGAADEGSRAEGRQFVLWGVIGFAVILSVWGLVNLVMNAAGLGVGTAPRPPIFTTGSTQTGSTPLPPPPPSSSGAASNGQSTINSGLGSSNASAQQQANATAAYQTCQSTCTGSNCGQQCQDAYSQALGQGSTQTGSAGGAGLSGGCKSAGGACDPGNGNASSGTCTTNADTGDIFCKAN